MAVRLLILLLFIFSSCQENRKTRADCPVIPKPLSCKLQSGTFTFGNSTVIELKTGDDGIKKAAEFLKCFVEQTGDCSIKIDSDDDTRNKIVFAVCDTISRDDAYTLKITPREITITSKSGEGAFYAVQTLRQLLPVACEKKICDENVVLDVPCVSIYDVPRFCHRGFMLDVARHYFPVDFIKKSIDMMALYKLNVLHLHLTDDQGWRIEIKSLPNLTAKGAWRAKRVGQWWQREPQQPDEEATYGGYYTQEDIKDVLAYAKQRYVRVIPEIDVPGHSLATLVAYPELACMKAPKYVNVGNKFYGEDENTLCAGKEETFEFLDKVFTEVAALFPDEYIHVGGDECFKGFWHKCPRCQARMKAENLKDENEMQSYVIHRLESILKAKGKKLIGWDEILEGGLAPDATVMSWRGMEGGIKAAKANHHVIMTPTQHCYLDLWQGEPSVEPDTYSMCRLSDSYRFNPVPDSVPAEMVLGGQGNLWSESVPTFHHAEYMTWPRGWALAEVLWSGPAKTDWDEFWPRVEKHFERADVAGINYARSMYNAIITPYKENNECLIKLDCELKDSDIYYTFDNTDPDSFSTKYFEPLRIPKNATWLRVVTYRNGKPSGKVITLRIDELLKRTEG